MAETASSSLLPSVSGPVEFPMCLASQPAITHFSVSDLGSSKGPIDTVSMGIYSTGVFCVAEPHCKPGLVEFTKDSHGNPFYALDKNKRNRGKMYIIVKLVQRTVNKLYFIEV